jgi:hypothetical protein
MNRTKGVVGRMNLINFRDTGNGFYRPSRSASSPPFDKMNPGFDEGGELVGQVLTVLVPSVLWRRRSLPTNSIL